MAGRNHVDVNERRLRPIYDHLDYNNNKKALQEADKVLKKQKDFLCAKVLKALALLRLGRHDESMSILQEVHDQHPLDDPTLQAMSICYKETNRLDLIADMYSNAHKKQPDNEEILSALFMSYVRLSDYKNQQQSAMRLHRLRPAKNPYYFWAVMSIVMQAHTSEQKLAQAMYLPLAEKMTEKYVTDSKIEAEAEVQLYLIILELREKYEKALEVIQGPMRSLLNSEANYISYKSAEYYGKLERWADMNLAYKALLLQESDQWSYYQEYFRSVFQLIDTKWSPENGNADDADKKDDEKNYSKADNSVESCRAFLEQIISSVEDGKRLRGPYLARIHLHKLLLDRGEVPNDKDDRTLVDLLYSYYEMFGDKPCCFSDLRPYIYLTCAEHREELVDRIVTSVGLDAATNDGEMTEIKHSDSLKHMLRHLLSVQLSRYIGRHAAMSHEEKYTLVSQLVARYHHGLQYGTALVPTDIQPSDTYILLAVLNLMDVYYQTNKSVLLWKCLLLLIAAVKKSPSNFVLKIVAIRIYAILGAFGQCIAFYETMDVKHVQHDAIGYIIGSHAVRLGHYYTAGSVYATMLKFFSSNHKDTTDLISSYKFGCFLKINEVTKFRNRLKHSAQYAAAMTERMLLDLTLEVSQHNTSESVIQCMEINPYNPIIDVDKLCDNRDFHVFTTWDPPDSCMTDALQSQSFEDEKQWVRYRDLTLRSLAAAVHLGMLPANSTVTAVPATTPNNGTNNTTVKTAKQGKSRRKGGKSESSPDEPTAAVVTNGSGNSPASGNHSDDSGSGNLGDVMQAMADQYLAFITEHQHTKQLQYPVNGPFYTRLHTAMQANNGALMVEMMHVLVYVHGLYENGMDTASDAYEEKLNTVINSKLKDYILDGRKNVVTLDENNKIDRINSEVLERAVTTCETICFLVLMAGCCYNLLHPVKLSLMKKAKKKKLTVTMPATFAHFTSLVQGLRANIEEMLTSLSEINTMILETTVDQFSDDIAQLNSTAIVQVLDELTEHASVWTGIQHSYQDSIRQMSTLINLKLQYLRGLKL